jgi:glycosyltransferase involved in cell wall biosynthesis
MRIALLSGAFPPQFDGIGDYSWWLSQELAAQGHQVTVFTSVGPARPQPDKVEVICCFDPAKPRTVQALPKAIRKAGPFDWLILQYNPFSYGPRGFSPWLISAVKEAGIPFALMLHETYVPLWPWRYSVMRTWQYLQFVLLVRSARAHFVSSERWIPQVNRWTKRACIGLPVGSNLPCCELSKSEARMKLGIAPEVLVVGIFGFAHGSKCLDWVVDSARSIHAEFPETLVLAVGQIGKAIREGCKDLPVLEAGRLPGADAALRLRAMDLFLAPFLDGISARRGSVIAALQHGIPTCSTFTEHSDRFLREFVSPAYSLTPVGKKEEFRRAALALAQSNRHRSTVAADLVELYQTYFDWPVIAQRTVETLSDKEPAWARV